MFHSTSLHDLNNSAPLKTQPRTLKTKGSASTQGSDKV